MKYIGVVITILYIGFDTFLDKASEEFDYLHGCYDALEFIDNRKPDLTDQKLCKVLFKEYKKRLDE